MRAQMGEARTDLPFHEWVQYVFQHAVTDPAWYFESDQDWWAGSAPLTAEYLARCFEDADAWLRGFSDAQVNQGLNYLISPSCSDHMFVLTNQTVPLLLRLRVIRSFYPLFEKCLARRCSPHLSHLDEPGSGQLNPVCYIWWDVLPIYGQPNDPDRAELDAQCLSVMERILALDSDACRESALHGLIS